MIERDTNLQEPTNPALNIASVSRCPSINFFNVDCIEFMKSKPDKYYDLAIVDPPYGLGKRTTDGGGTNSQIKFMDDIRRTNWDDNTPTVEYFEQLFRVSKNQIIWGGNYVQLPPTRGFLIWDKVALMDTMADSEFAWTSFDRNAKTFRHVRNTSEKRIHITQKPIKLYEWIIANYANQNDKILDTHLGSGSIAIAIEKANRLDKMNLQFVGIEIDKEYYEKALNRIEQYCRQGTLSF